VDECRTDENGVCTIVITGVARALTRTSTQNGEMHFNNILASQIFFYI
jgi:hypothetical protein